LQKVKYRLSYLPLFEEDLDDAWRYITYKLKNPAAAGRLINDTEAAILKRLEAPESFEAYPSHKEREYPYYRISIRNYTVWYVVLDDVMEIRRFLYSKRNTTELL
jgi:plasmid stabilization system protein ParE